MSSPSFISFGSSETAQSSATPQNYYDVNKSLVMIKMFWHIRLIIGMFCQTRSHYIYLYTEYTVTGHAMHPIKAVE